MTVPPTTNQPRANTGPSPRSWPLINELRPFEWSLHLPWPGRHKPYIALHVSQWGHNLYHGKSRRILHVQLMWGRLFSDTGGYRTWHPHGRFTA